MKFRARVPALLAAALLGATVVVATLAVSEHRRPASPPALAPATRPVHGAPGVMGVGRHLQALLERERRARIAALTHQGTVDAAVEREVLRRRLPVADLLPARRVVAAARRLARGSDLAAAELAVVLRRARDLAAAGDLDAGRIPAELVTLARNIQAARRHTVLADRGRVSFPGDPLVYERYAGEGLQIQWLGSWGRVNWLAGRCLAAARSCPRARLARRIDRLVQLASTRAGYPAWEYRFSFAGGRPPWVSAITQATAAQALARAGRALRAPRYERLARAAVGAFAAPPPAGVAVPAAGGGRHYLMYSFAPGLRILNGHVQALVALHDVAKLAHSRRAARLLRLGERDGAAGLRAYDTGAWSLYSANGAESTLSYHRLVAGFLAALCRRGAGEAYCAAGRRFVRYEHEPPRLGLALPGRVRARHPLTVRFALSKISTVSARASGPVPAAFLGGVELPHGEHVLRWTPPRPGRYRIVLGATDLAGNPATISRTIRVRPAHPRHHRRHHADESRALAASKRP